MKPCPKNRKRIVWLTLGVLDASQTRQLREHLETCEACRSYHAELTRLKDTLSGVEVNAEIEATAGFHQRVAARIRAESSDSSWANLSAHLRARRLNWRVALPVLGVTAALVLLLWPVVHHPGGSSPGPGAARAVLPLQPGTDQPFSLSNYRRVANQSLDQLDELLTDQAKRNPAPAPIYTASLLVPADRSD